ncbi:MAG TPA: hypothetical protein VIT22_03930 [Pseudoxanthomonas sp.]
MSFQVAKARYAEVSLSARGMIWLDEVALERGLHRRGLINLAAAGRLLVLR